MKKIVFISLLFYTLGACTSDHKSQDEHATHSEQEIVHEDHQHVEMEEIVLNKGEKWLVDENMMAYIRTMEKAISTFDTKKGNYASLAKTLQENVDLLTSNCTMTGQAHDELHKWLLPYIDLVDNLVNASDEDAAARTYDELIHSFETFNTYFI